MFQRKIYNYTRKITHNFFSKHNGIKEFVIIYHLIMKPVSFVIGISITSFCFLNLLNSSYITNNLYSLEKKILSPIIKRIFIPTLIIYSLNILYNFSFFCTYFFFICYPIIGYDFYKNKNDYKKLMDTFKDKNIKFKVEYIKK